MEVTISSHAAKRQKERGISETEVRAILASRETAFIPSKKDSEAIIVLGKIKSNVWGVVLNVNTMNVITVRKASKKERGFYEKEVKSH